MSYFKNIFTRKTLGYLALTFGLAGACMLATDILGAGLAIVSPFEFEYRTTHKHSDSIRLNDLQSQLEALAHSDPRVRMLRLEKQAQSTPECGPDAVIFTMTVRTRMWVNMHPDLIQKAYTRGLGKSCGAMGVKWESGSGYWTARGVVAVLVLILIWLSRHGRRPFRLNWSDWQPRVRMAGALYWGAASGVAMLFVVIGASWLASLAGLTIEPPGYLLNLTREDVLLALPSMIVLAPVLEEFVFRAWLLERLGRVFPVALALLLSAVAFAAMHLPQSVSAGGQLLLAGLLLGVLWWRLRSMMACVLAHGIYNAGAAILIWQQIA